MIHLTDVLVVGALLFSIGLYVALSRRNAVGVLMGIAALCITIFAARAAGAAAAQRDAATSSISAETTEGKA